MIHKFVEFIPENIEKEVIYISIPYSTAVHKCCCGCGNKVVTPISPTDWKLIFDGKSISLHPSIGNWGFKCQSHYWIKNNKVEWAAKWNKDMIDAGRKKDNTIKNNYYNKKTPIANQGSFLTKLKKYFKIN